jgi:succinyl-diaminopimelate desuccinylase
LNFIEACRKAISFETTPTASTVPFCSWIKEYAGHKGLIAEVINEQQSGIDQANVLIRLPIKTSSPEFMLQAHLDTRDPGPYGLWNQNDHNPFDASILEGKIFGLGAADVKLDLLCKINALSRFLSDKELVMNPVVVGTFGEESGMQGALKLIRKNKVSPQMALIGEPSDLKVIHAAKGYVQVEIQIPYSEDELKYKSEHNLSESTSTQSRLFSGKAAHSSTPHLGESAIKKMFDYLLQMPRGVIIMSLDGGVNHNTVPAQAFLEVDLMSGVREPMAAKLSAVYRAIKSLEQRFLSYEDSEFFPKNPTLSIGSARTLEDRIVLAGTCRIPPVVSNEVYENWMHELKQACSQVGADFRVLDYKRPYRAEPNSRLVRGALETLKQLGIEPELITQASTNEASLWSRVGVDCIAFGAGAREGNTHTPHESVQVADLEKSTEFYARMIERFCL